MAKKDGKGIWGSTETRMDEQYGWSKVYVKCMKAQKCDPLGCKLISLKLGTGYMLTGR